jgi:hypothetical protein
MLFGLAANVRVQRARAIDSTQVKTADRGLRLQPIVTHLVLVVYCDRLPIQRLNCKKNLKLFRSGFRHIFPNELTQLDILGLFQVLRLVSRNFLSELRSDSNPVLPDGNLSEDTL